MGISKLVDEFLLFGRRSNIEQSESPINGNTLLNMFSEWLFPAATVTKAGYEIGRAEAITCLCKIFSYLQRVEQFHMQYLERFYSALSAGLKGDFLSLCAVIKHSRPLFSLCLDGFRVLTPDYMKGLSRILPSILASPQEFLGQKIDHDALREDGYQVLSSIIFSFNLYPNTLIHFPVSDITLNQYIDQPIKKWVTLIIMAG